MFQISPCLASLLLTGFASPFFHNGSLKCEDEDEERQGVSDRNFIGYLLWDRTLDRTMNQNIGSRLKTPHLPIWVTNVNHQWGVLFNPKLDLMKSHAAENRWVVKELCQTSCWRKFLKVFHVLLQWTSWEKSGNNSDNWHQIFQQERQFCWQHQWWWWWWWKRNWLSQLLSEDQVCLQIFAISNLNVYSDGLVALWNGMKIHHMFRFWEMLTIAKLCC